MGGEAGRHGGFAQPHVVEKDALRDLQKSEIERQIQMRQNAWSDRLTHCARNWTTSVLPARRSARHDAGTSQEIDGRDGGLQNPGYSGRRQMADAELAAVEKSARLAHDLKEAQHARDAAESQLKHQADSLPSGCPRPRKTLAVKWRRPRARRSIVWRATDGI